MGQFVHACEGEMVCKSINPKIPYFNAPIFLENKAQIGKVDEILGPLNEVYFTVKVQDGIVATSFKPDDKVYIATDRLLPLERFLPKPKAVNTGIIIIDISFLGFLLSMVTYFGMQDPNLPVFRARSKRNLAVAADEAAVAVDAVVLEVEAVVEVHAVVSVVEHAVAAAAVVDSVEAVEVHDKQNSLFCYDTMRSSLDFFFYPVCLCYIFSSSPRILLSPNKYSVHSCFCGLSGEISSRDRLLWRRDRVRNTLCLSCC